MENCESWEGGVFLSFQLFVSISPGSSPSCVFRGKFFAQFFEPSRAGRVDILLGIGEKATADPFDFAYPMNNASFMGPQTAPLRMTVCALGDGYILGLVR